MRILVVEDERKIISFIKRGLKEEGYSVDTASDGEEGVFQAMSMQYDLIILDIMLPKKDGIRVLEELRLNNILSPILILTARNTVQDKVRGLDSGANDYLVKPFAFEELLARIRVLLRKPLAAETTKLGLADLELDLVSHKATRGGREISLSSKEYALLEYLVRNKGNVVTRTMISEHVWDMKFDTYTNIIDVFISYLRTKIDRGFSKKLIHTIRGRGYTIKE